MDTQEIANKLVEWCRAGQFDKCYQELYSPNAVSVEPEGALWERAEGMEEFRAKGEKWNALVSEMHGSEISEPLVAGKHFTVRMWSDLTFKDGNRSQLDEMCLYEVADGKIVKEQFFYEV